jgi:hypothetical protein
MLTGILTLFEAAIRIRLLCHHQQQRLLFV